MNDKIDKNALQALKVAFSYMPKAIEVNRYEYAIAINKCLSILK